MAGLGVWSIVLSLLIILPPLFIPPARSEGKGAAVEGAWCIFGLPICISVGAIWPTTIGPRFRRGQGNARGIDPAAGSGA